MKKNKTNMILSSIFFLLIIQFSNAQTTNPSPYCQAEYNRNYNMFDYLTIDGVTHNFGLEGSFNVLNTYEYYNQSVFTNLEIGKQISVQWALYRVFDVEPNYIALYIDLNHDNVFQTNELMLTNSNTSINNKILQDIIINENFILPANTQTGITRMRVMRADDGTGSPTTAYNDNLVIAGCNTPSGSNRILGTWVGCAYDFDINIVAAGGSVNVDELVNNKKISKATPNPTSGLCFIHLNPDLELKNIEVYSYLGKLVTNSKTVSNNVAKLNFSNLDNGVYFVSVSYNLGTKEVLKISKN